MSDKTSYTPPKIWEWDKESGGRFASMNRPTAGATHDQELPEGEHDLQLYSLGTPNGAKVTILLEELVELGISEAEYDAWPINIGENQQFGSGFVSINPNSKIPALLDKSSNPAIRVFESGAILVHLAEKFQKFLPTDPSDRAECMSWLFWQMGSAPYLGGGFGHFYNYAKEKLKYPIDRFSMETKRQLEFKEPGQEYAQVVRMLGNGRCECYCFDGQTRLGHIRGKMRKKVWVSAGDIILLGLRDFQDEKADVIHKYNADEARNLKAYGELPETARINETAVDMAMDDGDGEDDIGIDFDDI